MNLKIYAIVVTYNGSKWIDKCFGSLVNSTTPVKIIAIDNASSDGTPDIIKEKFPQVEVIETGHNLGFGKANNIGLKRVLEENADYAFLLNQDAWVEEDTIEKLVDVQQKNPEFGILSPVPYDGTEKEFDRQFKLYYSKPHDINNIRDDDKINKVSFINAAGWLVSNNTIKKTGLFHHLFFQRGEDVDYANRCHYHNINIGFHNSSKYYHDRQNVWHKNISHPKRIQSTQSKLNITLNNINKSPGTRVKMFFCQIKTLHSSKQLTLTDTLRILIRYIFKGPYILLKSNKLKQPYC